MFFSQYHTTWMFMMILAGVAEDPSVDDLVKITRLTQESYINP